MEQTKWEPLELTDAELEGISGGNWFGEAVRFVIHALPGPAMFADRLTVRTDRTALRKFRKAASISGLFVVVECGA